MIRTSKKSDTEFKLPVEKLIWSRWGENYYVPSNKKHSLLLWFESGSCFDTATFTVRKFMLSASRQKKDIYPRKLFQSSLCKKHHTLKNIFPEFLFVALKCIIGLLNSLLEANLLRTTTYQKKPAHAEQLE